MTALACFTVFLAVMQALGTKAVASLLSACRSLLRSTPTTEKLQRAQPLHHSKCFAGFGQKEYEFLSTLTYMRILTASFIII